jgi:hypothetical protein
MMNNLIELSNGSEVKPQRKAKVADGRAGWSLSSDEIHAAKEGMFP